MSLPHSRRTQDRPPWTLTDNRKVTARAAEPAVPMAATCRASSWLQAPRFQDSAPAASLPEAAMMAGTVPVAVTNLLRMSALTAAQGRVGRIIRPARAGRSGAYFGRAWRPSDGGVVDSDAVIRKSEALITRAHGGWPAVGDVRPVLARDGPARAVVGGW